MTFVICNQCDEEVEVVFNADKDPNCPECRYPGDFREIESVMCDYCSGSGMGHHYMISKCHACKGKGVA
jgi:hypothetical protein